MSREREARKVVLVTGASSGIGAAVAREATRKGHALALTARRLDRLEALAGEVRVTGGDALVLPAALEDPGSTARIVAGVVERYGRLDVLINNAGIGLPALFADCDPDQIRRQVEVNFAAPLLLTRHALPYLLERRGVVINIGSSITCVPNPALGAYGATKEGLAYWSFALRRELRHKGVKVCLVEPGPVQTEFFHALQGLRPSYHPMLDSPSPWLTADVDEAARRIVRLIERPRRRVSVLKRVVWPWRCLGGLFQVWPSLGDYVVSSVVRYYEGVDPRTTARSGRPRHAAPRD